MSGTSVRFSRSSQEAEPTRGPPDHLLLTFMTCSSVLTGCIDGMVGVAARVASVPVSWLTLEVEPNPDLTNHITGVEAMISELQQKVREAEGTPPELYL